MYDFKFGNTWLSSLGAHCTKPDREIAQRSFSLVDIPGRDGSDYLDSGFYKNVVIKREVALVSKTNISADEKAEALINSLAYLQGYQTFEETTREGLTTFAVLTNFQSVANSLRTLKKATLEFSRLPFWYSKTGMEAYEVTSGGITLKNPFPVASKPRFICNLDPAASTARLTFSVGDTSYTTNGIQYDAAHTILEIDSEYEQAFVRNSDGEVLRFIDMDFPHFEPGAESTVTLTLATRVTSVTVEPRWRCL